MSFVAEPAKERGKRKVKVLELVASEMEGLIFPSFSF
jgi:hypothetical protein